MYFSVEWYVWIRVYISVEVCFVGLVFVSVDVEAVCSVPCVVDFVVVVCV